MADTQVQIMDMAIVDVMKMIEAAAIEWDQEAVLDMVIVAVIGEVVVTTGEVAAEKVATVVVAVTQMINI